MSPVPLIAIVDDDTGVRASLDALVRSLGYRVTTFASAEAFLGSSDAAQTDCVISDLQMPGGMSGIELLQEITTTGWGMPFVLVSAFYDERVRAQAFGAGAHCFLRKPLDESAFINCLDRALLG